jgi:hypothetical protein
MLQRVFKAIRTISIIIVSICVSVLLLELSIRVLRLEQKTLIFSWVNKNNEPVIYTLDSRLIWSHLAQNTTVQPSKRNQVFSSDEHGFRTTLSRERQDQPVQYIVMVGESFTFGEVVENTQTSSSVLQEQLNRHGYGQYQVINAGVTAYGPDQTYQLIKQKIQKKLSMELNCLESVF